MKFKHKVTGIIYNVVNPEVLPLYEGNDTYEEITEKKAEKAEPKKAKKAD